jgi:hypothetical protein
MTPVHESDTPAHELNGILWLDYKFTLSKYDIDNKICRTKGLCNRKLGLMSTTRNSC